MKTLLKTIGLAILVVGLSNPAYANPYEKFNDIRSDWSEQGINTEIIYTGEYWANTKGGMKRDDTYLGNLDLSFSFNMEELLGVEGGTFFVYFLDNHGGKKLTGSIIGDTQTVSNIEAPRATRLYEIWYEQQFHENILSILFGVHDLNSEFAFSDNAGLFINSSFGIGAEMAAGARPSIFPLAAPAIRVKYTPNEEWEFLFGVYDGNPDDPENVEQFPRFDFDSDGGALLISEITHHCQDPWIAESVTLKIGVWKNTGKFDDQVDTDYTGSAISRQDNYGGYLVVDKKLFSEEADEDQGLSSFFQFGMVPEHINEIEYYIGTGFTYAGLIPNRDQDTFGVAMAHAAISDDLPNRDNAETTLELTYSAQINDHIRIQPDIQFVFNPGADPNLNNAIVTGMRFEMAL